LVTSNKCLQLQFLFPHATGEQLLSLLLPLGVLHPVKMIAITLAQLTVSIATRNHSTKVIFAHCLRFFSHEFFLLTERPLSVFSFVSMACPRNFQHPAVAPYFEGIHSSWCCRWDHPRFRTTMNQRHFSLRSLVLS